MRQRLPVPALEAETESGQTVIPAGPDHATKADDTLIVALRNSTTRNDQIVQRRIGKQDDTQTGSTKSRRAVRNSCPEE